MLEARVDMLAQRTLIAPERTRPSATATSEFVVVVFAKSISHRRPRVALGKTAARPSAVSKSGSVVGIDHEASRAPVPTLGLWCDCRSSARIRCVDRQGD